MMSVVRNIVSKKKRRFRENGFDLDLSYITPRTIVMGFPAEGKEGLFRNPLSEVMRFLTTYHDRRFKVINLCAEREYDPNKLGGNGVTVCLGQLPALLLQCLQNHLKSFDDEWLSKNENNVLVTHCKAGKGRAGMMLCCFLLYTKYCPDPLTSLQFYAEKRTKNGKGVTIPSQRRYVGYFYDFIEKGPSPSVKLELAQISFTANIICTKDINVVVYSNHGKGTCKLQKVLSTLESKTSSSKSGRTLILGLNPTWIDGDVKVEFFANLEAPVFYFWFNTAYINGSDFSLWSKEELDKPPKNMESDIQVSLFFTRRLPSNRDEESPREPCN